MKKNKPTQKQKIIAYIEKYGSITQHEAIIDLGVYRLPSRMNELKNMGYTFKRETIKAKNRDGEPTHFAKYSELVAPAV